MMGAWLGQSVGVAYGCPTEFRYNGTIVPADKMPVWKPELVNNTFVQDDLYVEMTFLDTLCKRGLGVTTRAAGIDFANSAYRLWCANSNARNNLRNGIAAPASSHPKFHATTDDIDYQIEADFSGILAPGLPQAAVDFGETFGRIMNYGDGLYAGQFVGALYAEAYFETDRVRLVEKALKAIPSESKYAGMVRDMLAWHAANPTCWQATWTNAVEKYFRAKANLGRVSNAQINVKVNGAMVLLGLLHGEGDMDRTMFISTAGGFDSDCNPSSACGVLGVMTGFKKLEAKYFSKLDRTKKWEFTDFTWDGLIAASDRLVRQVVVKYGGRIEKDAAGAERLVLPVAAARPSPFFDSCRPGPVPSDDKLTEAEREEIRYLPCNQGAQSARKKVK
ncbi:MAG: ADP-ribosylglycohydrolase family protein, partial [Kiritimatiellae bacterium]|nr:ADP-ribosylglycohydrolase family protein [Kiritimatiellia bacterium]